MTFAKVVAVKEKPQSSRAYDLLEAALIEYAERYGLTDQARKALTYSDTVGDFPNASIPPILGENARNA